MCSTACLREEEEEEELRAGQVHDTGRTLDGHVCRGFGCDWQHRAFRRACWFLCVQGAFLSPPSYSPSCRCCRTPLPMSLMSPVSAEPFAAGCRLPLSCTPCVKPYVVGVLWCLVLTRFQTTSDEQSQVEGPFASIDMGSRSLQAALFPCLQAGNRENQGSCLSLWFLELC